MCGIIGYIGKKQATPILLEGLKKLEYRGYDSAGIATISKNRASISKCKGKIQDLENILKKRKLHGCLGIGHTRWATHGKPSKINAHPHSDCLKEFIVVHNGIIENFAELRKDLIHKGCKFSSETDTEIVVHMVSQFYRGSLEEAVIKAIKKLRGSFALGIISVKEPDKIVAVRNDSPLIIGIGKSENYIASDASAILAHTRKVIYMHDREVAVLTRDNVKVFDLGGRIVDKKIDTVSFSIEEARKSGFKHFMLKEIFEQPKVLSRIVSQYVGAKHEIKFPHFHIKSNFLKKIDNIIILACGTAHHAGLVGKYAIESFTRIPVWADLGSEFRYRNPVIKKNTLVIAISQSGETADTLAAVRQARKDKAKVLSICNVVGSTLTRESDSVIYIQAGPEISVASTKAYTAQVMVLYLFGLYLATLRNTLAKSYIEKTIKALREIPLKQKKILDMSLQIKRIAKRHLHFGAFLYLGRNINYPTALEGALKLKEISYIPAEGYAAGEMKHGPIALIDEYRGVICIANDSFVYDKMLSNIQEILARRGKITIVASRDNAKVRAYCKEIIYIPKIREELSSLLTIIPLQLLAYFIADLKGYDVDKPRNLAKSVTVE